MTYLCAHAGLTCCQRGRGVAGGERIIEGFVQNAEMKEEDENDHDKVGRALLSLLIPVRCLPWPEEEQSLSIFGCPTENCQSPVLP